MQVTVVLKLLLCPVSLINLIHWCVPAVKVAKDSRRIIRPKAVTALAGPSGHLVTVVPPPPRVARFRFDPLKALLATRRGRGIGGGGGGPNDRGTVMPLNS